MFISHLVDRVTAKKGNGFALTQVTGAKEGQVGKGCLSKVFNDLS